MSYPDHWIRITLNDVGVWGSGGTPKRSEPRFYGGTIPWLVIGDLTDGEVAGAASSITEAGLANSAAKMIPAGAVLVAMYGSIGKMGLTTVECATNQAIAHCLPFTSSIDTKFLFYYLRSQRENLLALGKGGAQQNISQTVLMAYGFPLAPFAEQKQIANKLDELLAQVDSIKTRLDAIPAILKRFRQSVLAAAVSGRLTDDWRQIKGVGFEDWKWEKAAKLCETVQSGSTPKGNPFEQGGEVPFLKVYNIVGQSIAFDARPQFVTREVHEGKLKRSIVKPGDILMNIVGPPLGKVAIVPDHYREWNINQAITLFRANPRRLKEKFLYYLLCEGAFVRDVMLDTKGIVGQVNISLTQCREARFPEPPLEEQTEIVRRIDQMFSFASQIEQRLTEAQARINQLTQSILAKAFRGELTADWREQHPELISGENSAEALLASIKAKRAKLEPKKRAARKRVAAK